MKVKGFTLIELLAIIVILSIIALVATPIILNIVGTTKNSAILRSGELYLDTIESTLVKANLEEEFNPISCVVQKDGNVICDEKLLEIKMNGNRPSSGVLLLENGKIVSVSGMILDNYELVTDEKENLIINGKIESNVTCKTTSNMPIPELYEGLVPVIYSNDTWKIADTSEKWYNYSRQEWANAVILKNNVTKNVGEPVDISSEVQGIFVWIPRYEYKYTNLGGKYAGGTKEQPGEIEVNFISALQTTPSCDNYKIHPAFKFGNKNLGGIWVGKFETSTDTNSVCYTDKSSNKCNDENQIPYVLPNVSSLRDQNIKNQFVTAQKFNIFLTNADSHMMKNNEWGAAAYLSQSKYGKYGNSLYIGPNKEIYQNKSDEYITGSSNGTPSTSLKNNQCAYNDITDRGNGTGSCGGGASTTGNITGIYDMSGGTWEYVMGVYNNSLSLSGFSEFPNDKYYFNYSEDETSSCNGDICFGHSLVETNGWYNDYLRFVNAEFPWFVRGGSHVDSNLVGIFYASSNTGRNFGSFSFRITISK